MRSYQSKSNSRVHNLAYLTIVFIRTVVFFNFVRWGMENSVFKGQTVILKDGRVLTADGIRDIIGFTDGEIMLECEGGKICVEGDGLKIEGLSKDGGKIEITGDIFGVFRTPEKKAKHSLFRK